MHLGVAQNGSDQWVGRGNRGRVELLSGESALRSLTYSFSQLEQAHQPPGRKMQNVLEELKAGVMGELIFIELLFFWAFLGRMEKYRSTSYSYYS